jgi:hypothetical protein
VSSFAGDEHTALAVYPDLLNGRIVKELLEITESINVWRDVVTIDVINFGPPQRLFIDTRQLRLNCRPSVGSAGDGLTNSVNDFSS